MLPRFIPLIRSEKFDIAKSFKEKLNGIECRLRPSLTGDWVILVQPKHEKQACEILFGGRKILPITV